MKYSNVALHALIGLHAIGVADSACVPDRAALDSAISGIIYSGVGYTYSDWGPIENWCFGDDDSLKDFSYLFEVQPIFGTKIFNADISGWDVSSVTNMNQMVSFNDIWMGDLME
jgi:hypothetical protein